MWLRHLIHLLEYSGTDFIQSIGSTWLGFTINALFAVGTTAITLYIVHRKRGKEAMLTHWKDELRTAFRVGITCAACLYVPVGLFAICKAVYEDHQGLVAISQGQRNAINRIVSKPVAPNAHIVSDTKKHVTILLLTDKVQIPALVIMTCDGPVVKPFARMAETSFMFVRPPVQIPNTNTWAFEVQSPAWTPTEPMFIDYDYVTSIKPKCGFEAKDQKP